MAITYTSGNEQNRGTNGCAQGRHYRSIRGCDILECGICKLFARHGFSKYASLLCEVDYITSTRAGLQLVRTGTIANGAERCDFRFKRID